MIDPGLIARLRAALPAEALVAGEGLAGRTEDWMRRQPIRSPLLLRPASTREVSAALALCHAAGQPVITHGGLTGLLHGAGTTPGDVVQSLERMRGRGLEPASAVRKLYEWSRNHFQPEMVEHFIKCVGIYPVGTLVLLESGLLGFVIDFMEDTLLKPTVRVVYDTRKQWYVSPYDLDLAAPNTADRVLSWEQPERWKLAPENYTLRL